MPQTRGKLEDRIREVEARLPIAFDWYSGNSQPAVGVQGVTFWEDRANDVGKIVMRRKNKVYVITGYAYDEGTSVTISPDQHAHRHATGNSSALDVGADPITPYSFTWTYSHLFQRTSDVVSIKVDPSSVSGEDPVQFLDDAGNEKLIFTSSGLVALGGATEQVQFNVRGSGGAPTPLSPDQIADPLIWMDADDITGVGDGNSTNSVPEKATSNSFTQFTGSSGFQILYYSGAGSEGINGHATVAQNSSPTDLTLNYPNDSGDPGYDNTVKLTGAFTILVVTEQSASFDTGDASAYIVAGAGKGNGAVASGIAVHKVSGGSRPTLYTDASGVEKTVTIGDPFGSDNTNGPRIAIFRRNASPSTTIRYYATRTEGDTQVSLTTTHADVANDVHINGLCSKGSDNCPAGLKIAEVVVWDSELSDTQVLQLYQWAAQKYGITQLTTGGTSAQVRIETDASNYTYLETEADGDFTITPTSGLVGINTSPAASLHILDATEQLRLDYDGSSYLSATISSVGDWTVDLSTGDEIDFNFGDSGGGIFTCANSTGAMYITANGTTDAGFAMEDTGIIKWQIRMDGSGAGEANALVVSAGNATPIIFSAMPSGLFGINTDDPQATLEVVKTTEQLRLTYDASNYISHTVALDGALTVNAIGTDPEFIFADRMTIQNDTSNITLDVDGSGAGDTVQFRVQTALGDQTSDYAQFLDNNGNPVFKITNDGIPEGPASNAEGGARGLPFFFRSVAENSGSVGVKTPAYYFDTSYTVSAPAIHTRWTDNDAATVIMDLETSSKKLYKGDLTNGNNYWGRTDTANWTGVHSFSARPEFDAGITLEADGTIHSDVVDGASSFAFDLVSTIAKTTGYSFRLRNSADSKEIMRIGYDGKLILGYSTTVSGISNALMSFVYNDNTNKQVDVGMAGIITHGDASINNNRLYGVGGATAILAAASVPGTKIVGGVIGAAACAKDSASFSGKIVAGVVGNLAQDNLEGTLFPSLSDKGGIYAGADLSIAGNWDLATTFYAMPLISAGYKGAALTNLPAIASSFKGTIPEITTGECWGMYLDAVPEIANTKGTSKSYYYPQNASIAGALRLPFPRHGQKRIHAYFIPGDLDDAGTGALGYVVFDDGDGTTMEGLWEHDGTAYRKLVPQTDHSSDVTSTTATLGGIGGGPAAAAQVGWVKIKINNGSGGGTTGWIPYWQ